MSDSISETDAIFARAYASAIKNKFSLNFGNGQVLFLSPLVQRGIAGGDLIYQQMTNFLTYKFGDTLLPADDPSYLGGAGNPSYIQDLRTYIDYIYTKTDRSPAVVREMASARKGVDNADNNYDDALTKAQGQWKSQKDAGITDQKFWDWTQYNAKYLSRAIEEQKQAQTHYDSVAQQYYGPQAGRLADIRGNIRKAMDTNPQSKNAGFNQEGITADRDLISSFEEVANGGKKPPADDLTPYILQVPDYGIQGYHASMNEWMRLAAQQKGKREQVITIDVSQGKKTSWQDYGYKEVHGSGSVGIFPFFSASAKYEDREEKFTLNTAGKETEISFKIAAYGIQLMPVNAGLWDIPDIKRQFELTDDAPSVLDSKYARPMSVLVGYDVALTVSFGSSMKKEVNEWYDKAKKTGGGLSIFGFRVSGSGGVGSEEKVHTSFDGVEWDEASGTITLTPAPKQVYPSILAVLGQRL